MARSQFGGRASDSVATLFPIGARSVLAPPTETVTLEVWSGPEADGGTKLTDLLAADGTTAITAVTVPASAHGQIPVFYGPDGVSQVWFRDTEGDFYRLDADAGSAAVRAEAAAAAAEAVGTTNDTIIAGRIQDPASATATALSSSIDTVGRGIFARKAVVNIADYATGVFSDATSSGKTFNLAAVVQAMEELDGSCYIPAGDWLPDSFNIALNETNVATVGTGSQPTRFAYVFQGQGPQSRLRLPAAMTASDYLLLANSTDAATHMVHPKLVFRNFGVSGMVFPNPVANFVKTNQRSLQAEQLFFSAVRNGFHCTGYMDLVRLDGIYGMSMSDAGWLFENTENGDGMVFRQVFLTNSQGIKLKGVYGAAMEECVGGFHEFIECNVSLRDNHLEGNGTTWATPVVTLKGCTAKVSGGQYQTTTFRPTFRIDDTGYSSNGRCSRVTFDGHVQFLTRVDDNGAPFGYVRGTDIEIVDLNLAGELRLEHGVHNAIFHSSTAKGLGGNQFGGSGRFALNVTSSNADIQTALTNGRAFLGDACVLKWTTAWFVTPPFPRDKVIDTTSFNAPSLSTILGSAFDNFAVSDLAAGTYYYRAWTIDATGRPTDKSTEASVTITANQLINVRVQTWESPVILRVLRGTAASTYTEWVEIPIAQPSQTGLVDTGLGLSGYAWSAASVPTPPTGTSGVGYTRRGTKRLDNGKAVIIASAAPTAGQTDAAGWAVGDEVVNSAPAAGGTPGWVCTTAGSPGTWKARANLTA